VLDLIIALITRALPFFKTKAGLYLIAALVVAGASAYGGWWVRDAKAESEQLSAVKRAIVEANEQWDIDREILEDSVEIQIEIKTVFKYIEKEVEDVEIADCVDLGDDWRRLYNDAVRAASTDFAD